MKRKILAAVAALAVSLLAYSAPAHAAHRVGPGTPPKITAHNTHKTHGVKALKGHPSSAPFSVLTTCGTPPCFDYAKGQQTFSSSYPTQVQGRAFIANPYVENMGSGNHSLMEIAVTHTQATGKQNRVEFGWTKDSVVCGQSTDPCMFAGYWADDVFGGYGGGFVRYTGSGASAYGPGSSLSSLVGTAHLFGIYLDTANNNVWVYFTAASTAEWVGYFPASLWTGSNMGTWDLSQPFAEVADVAKSTPCTDMATGDLATTTVGGYWTSMAHNAGATAASYAWSVQPSGINAEYNAATFSATTGRLGGPGWNAAGTGVGTKGSC